MTPTPSADRLEDAFGELGGVVPEDLHDQLVRAWSEPHRHYHGLAHLIDCLAEFDGERDVAERAAEVELALWFHDAVYDPRSQDNEQRSADWAVRALDEAGIDPATQARVRDAILGTAGHRDPVGPDQALLFDIDLSILGRDPAAFDAYDRAIRREYAFVPDDHYRIARTDVLRDFLGREPLFHTAPFRDQYEAQARANLRRALESLQG